MSQRTNQSHSTISILDAHASLSTRHDRPQTPDELHEWLLRHLGLTIPERAIVDGHSAPLEYLVHTYFEGKYHRGRAGEWALAPLAPAAARTADCIVWASRGGGKTFLGAVATLLDLLFKPAVQVRVLAGSLEQSQRMHEYLRTLLARPGISGIIDGRVSTRAVNISTGACVRVLAASQTSVRGTRVQKIRCDEVDLFDPDLWRAAQLVTRSIAPSPGPWGSHIRGSVEALSTMHRPYGLMWDLVGDLVNAPGADASDASDDAAPPHAHLNRPPVFRWGVVDVLERCAPERPCDSCILFPECAGRAKHLGGGHIRIDDAVQLKGRVDRATWESEMLCLRPRRTHAVYPEFSPDIHVLRLDSLRPVARWHAAMDFGIRSESVVLLASVDDAGTIIIDREHAAANQPVPDQIAVLKDWLAQGACPEGLATIAIDPAGFNRSEQTGDTNAALLRAHGWTVRGPSATIHAGLRLVRRRLAPAAGDPPTLFIHPRCTRLIECLTRYHFPEHKAQAFDPVKDGPDHACDALKYLVASLDAGEGVRVRGY